MECIIFIVFICRDYGCGLLLNGVCSSRGYGNAGEVLESGRLFWGLRGIVIEIEIMVKVIVILVYVYGLSRYCYLIY